MKRLLAIIIILILFPVAAFSAEDEFDLLREKWVEVLTGGDYVDTGEVYENYIKPIVTKNTADAQFHWDNMIKPPNRVNSIYNSYLWSDLQTGNTMDIYARHSSRMNSTYSRLVTMTLAYVQKGSGLKGNTALRNDIISALDWLYTYKFNENTPRNNRDGAATNDNWFYWEIAIPRSLNNIQAMLYSDLTSVQIANYQKAIDNQVTTLGAASTGANRLNCCLYLAVGGIVKKDANKIRYARDAVSPALPYVTADDGFYTDGSFIQHHTVPYNGGYGLTSLGSFCDIMYLLENSSYSFTDPNKNNIYEWVENAFIPTSFEGRSMDSSVGRYIARTALRYDLPDTLTKIAFFAPTEKGDYYKSVIKRYCDNNLIYDYYARITNIFTLSKFYSIMNDENVTQTEDFNLYKQFYNMDRFVLHRPDYSFNAAMYSDRIRNYESINGENLQGWHTASGMTYLYNSDLLQYEDNYFATIDKYRLPGITAIKNTTAKADSFADPWAGGVENAGIYGVSGMQFYAPEDTNNRVHTLRAKKSWFMFDDEIVCLGSDINSETAGDSIETIVENRKINGNNLFTVDGVVKNTYTGWNEVLTNISWAHLEGNPSNLKNKAKSDIGYYFPNGSNINALSEARTDSWKSMNSAESSTQITRNYLSMAVDHGVMPLDNTYEYVLLPNKTAQQIEAYANNPDIEIIANNSLVQSVSETKNNIIGANFWTDSVVTAGILTSNKKASVMMSTDVSEGICEISISDPTQKNTENIRITIDKSFYGVESLDDGVTVSMEGNKTAVTVSALNSRGRTYKARLYTQNINPQAPRRPENLTVDGRNIKWNGVIGADNYSLYRSENESSGFVKIAEDSFTEFRDKSILLNVNYYYKVRAENMVGASEFSDVSRSLVPKPVYLINDNFNDFSIGNLHGQNGWTFLESPNSAKIEKISDTNNILRIYRPDGTKSSTVEKAFSAPLNSILTVEATITPDGSKSDYKMLLAVSTMSGAAVYIYSQNGSLYAYDGKSTSSKVTIYNGDFDVYKTYIFKVVIRTKEKKFDFYINDDLKVENLGYRYSTASFPTSLLFAPGNSNNTLTIDDVRVYHFLENPPENSLSIVNNEAHARVINNLSEEFSATGIFIIYKNGRISDIILQKKYFAENEDYIFKHILADTNVKAEFMLLGSMDKLNPLIYKLSY